MALHQEKVGLLKESLLEMVHVAEYAVTYKKTDHSKWGANATGGILGFPATVTIFSIIDCIGSVFKGDNNFKIIIDGEERHIKRTSQHIYILNSRYFNLNLTQFDLNNIYDNFRSTLSHNSLMPEGYILQIGEAEKGPFKIAIDEFDNRIYFTNLVPLFKATKKAVQEFIADLENRKIDFTTSNIHQAIKKRDIETKVYLDPRKPGEYQIRIKKWIKE